MKTLRVLALNAGSRTIKAQILEVDEAARLASARAPLWSGETVHGQAPAEIRDAVKSLLASAGAVVIDAVAHRVVQTSRPPRALALVLDDAVLAEVVAAETLDPLHTRAVRASVEAVRDSAFAPARQVVVFDGAFHRSLPDAAAIYGAPYEWFAQGYRKIGYHGLSYSYCAARLTALLIPERYARTVCAHLGAGCSLAALREGASVETTMGYTPLDGLMMASRSGAVDPGLLLFLVKTGRYNAAELEEVLNEESGLRGVAGGSGDLRDVRAAAEGGDPRASLALAAFIHRVSIGIGAMAAALGGLDALVFTGGIGERDAATRAEICAPLAHLGIRLDAARNAAATADAAVEAEGALPAYVLHTREEWAMALAARDALERAR